MIFKHITYIIFFELIFNVFFNVKFSKQTYKYNIKKYIPISVFSNFGYLNFFLFSSSLKFFSIKNFQFFMVKILWFFV